MPKIIVAIYMITYNHEQYIIQAIEAILMQKTDFEYKLFIGEDCSTDRTRQMCINYAEKYSNKIELIISDKNIGANLNAQRVYKACFDSGAKYIALCEGDDYWTDPLKLQKQVDFLEANSDYVLCGTDAQLYNNSKAEFDKNTMLHDTDKKDFCHEDLLSHNRLITLTVMFRNNSILKKLPEWFLKSPYGDWPLYAFLTKYGRARNLDFVSGVYRQHDGGIFSGATNLKNNYNDVIMYKLLMSEFKKVTQEGLNNYLKSVFWVYCETKERAVKREMILNYMQPFRVSVFFDRIFLSMVKRYFI